MGAIYGIMGHASLAEVEAMGRRLVHRGSEHAAWRATPTLHLGRRSKCPACPLTDSALVLDGAIENLPDLAELLRRPADNIEGLIQELFRRFGPDGFKYIRGAFSLALWDSERETLVLARDLFGARSLSYAALPRRFVFASEYKALLALPDVPATPNLDTIQHINSTRNGLSDASCLAEVFPVPPGHWVRIKGRRVEQGRYWTPEIRIAGRSDSEHIQAVRGTFLEAVKRQVASFDRIGVALSGGLDSASVVAGIRHVAPDRDVHTFCAGFGPEDPELTGAAETARHFGTIHHDVVVPPEALPDMLPAMVWHLEDPVGREDVPYIYACAQEARHSVDVMFGGHLVDALLGGMPRHRLVRLAHTIPLARRLLSDPFRYTRAGLEPQTLIGAAILRRYFQGGIFLPPRIRGASKLPELDLLRISEREPLTQHLLHSLLDHQGEGRYDRLQTPFAADYQAPCGDPDFVRCAFETPDRLKIRGRTQKYILRQALKDLLPPSISARRKSLARLRNDAKLADVIEALANHLLAPAAVRERGVFELEYVERARRREARQRYPEEQLYRLWTMLLTELWFRIFVDGRGAFPSKRFW